LDRNVIKTPARFSMLITKTDHGWRNPNKFRKLGLIDYNGHIDVHNSLLSAVLHDKQQLKEND
jgi:hypothetical protein